ncbi:MAG TPA: hypothetical protein VFH06_02490 [Candidatus Saccharimonadales bacterium]|nr:hypothetical protein [Candidatus Saccharimonadales bacterium]
MKKPLLAFAAKSPASLEMAGEKRALALFHETAQKVPAYKDFLAKEKVDHKKIKTIADFKAYVPIVDKKNYLSQYPLKDLCFEGDLFSNHIVSVSSGSSGVPTFWPRGTYQDIEGSEMFGEIYDNSFAMQTKKTLAVVCFSMGTWIAGTFTTTATLLYADKGRPVNVVTPGLEREETVKAIKNLAGNYEQIVLIGYPPFIKDMLDEGRRVGINWRHLKVRLLLASESFSEEWRDYVLRELGSKDPFYDTSSIYGSADAGIFGVETPLSILIRRIYNQRSRVRQKLFGTPILPSFVQYDPRRRYFEKVQDNLVFTARSGVPLIRYDIQDAGGIVSFQEAIEPIHDRLYELAQKYNVNIPKLHQPFLYVHGRKLFSTTIYGVNIYPENIKAALIDRRVRKWTTGLFTMSTKNYSDMDQYFEINVELRPGFIAKSQHQLTLEAVILEKLVKLNAEFHKLHEVIGVKVRPQVHLVSFGDSTHFPHGAKHKWVEKET